MLKRMIKIFSVLLMFAGWPNLQISFASSQPKVGIIQIVEHEALDSVRTNALETIKSHPEFKNVDIEYFNAQGNFVTLGQIGRKLLGSSFDVIFAIGTPAAQTVSTRNRSTPVVFSPITDPVSAKLVHSLNKPGGLVTGVSDYIPLKPQLELIKQINPKIKKVGILYNSGEANSQKIASEFKTVAQELGLTPIEGIAQNTAMVLPVCKANSVDAWYIPTDNTVASAIESVLMISKQQGIPVFVADKAHLKKGALAGLSLEYAELGRMSGEMIIRILKGEKPGELPVGFIKNPQIYLNQEAAQSLSLKFPEALVKIAQFI